jgi:PAS domain S-box-containing protein
LNGLRHRAAELEATEAGDRQVDQPVRDQTELLTLVSDLAINLTAAPPEADLCALIAQGLKAITRALATAILTYDPETGALLVECIAVDRDTLSQINELLGSDVVGLRIPVSQELVQQMLVDLVRTTEDLSDSTLGAVPRSLSSSLQSGFDIDRFTGLSLHYGEEFMGMAVMVMSKGQTLLPAEVMKILAHITAVSLRRKQAEEALRESEEQYRTLVETSPDGIMMMDLQARITMANRELAELYGAESVEELLGRSSFEFIAPEELPRGLEGLKRFQETRIVRNDEYRLLRKDGSDYPAETSATLVEDAHGHPKAIITVVRDISERKRMEDQMQQRNRELELLNLSGQALNASLDLKEVLDTALDQACSLFQVEACSVWLIDPETNELVCRSATGPHIDFILGWRLQPGEGLTGWVAQRGESLIVPDMLADERHFRDIEQEIGPVLRSALSVPMRIKEDLIGVLQVLHKDVDHFEKTDLLIAESLATSAAIALENARLYEDLQARMVELRDAQAKLVQSAKMAAIGELAAGVAHEINTPLTSVLGFSELLLERADPDDQNRQRLEAVIRQAGRARDIVSNLLDFSRQTEFHRESADLNQLVRETLGLVRNQLQRSGVALKEHYGQGLPLLMLDTARMKQVFLNLFTNALDAMPNSGTLTIRSDQVEDGVMVCVADTGQGISEEDQARIFEPFFTTKPVGQGTGLGLSVSLGIVQDHGGHIGVESCRDKGSTFTVWLPVDPTTDRRQN